MFEIRAYDCPQCSATNGVSTSAIAHSELAGVETWGVCWECAEDFQLTLGRRRRGGVDQMIAATRSPIASNVSFSMWRRRLP